uniref:Anaphase-promoting complex subunit 11 n=1 Tax=Araucaria cunninghamii TaxID=56994 RepID=A0A0D6QV46_ARACU
MPLCGVYTEMGSRWRKAKNALGLHLCTAEPLTLDDRDHDAAFPGYDSAPSVFSSGSRRAVASRDLTRSAPLTPARAHSPKILLRTGSRSSRKTCAICLDAMKPGHGHALFTAECSHTFHFPCIASNVKHGNRVCPVCRAKWKEVPFQGPPSEPLRSRTRINPVDWPQQDGWTTVLHRLPPPRPPIPQAARHVVEPNVYNDDEPLEPRTSGGNRLQDENRTEPNAEVDMVAGSSEAINSTGNITREQRRALDSKGYDGKSVELEMFPEFSAVPHSEFLEKFTVLVHVKAPISIAAKQLHNEQNERPWTMGNPSQNSDVHRDRAPIDLVTVLDVSGSMAGTKLALLKRAMGFVIHNLGPMDRLSVVAFSSTARRLFPLQRMSEGGRQFALQAVNGLVSTGGTNIAEGLKKGAKVLEDRREQNPVCSIILLSDGQDTYNVGNHRQSPFLSNPRRGLDYQSLLPGSIRQPSQEGDIRIPVHTFGFGTDHDSASMHCISETSGGTFSFIETESVIQDAFAQCIGGLLSVVIQDMQVSIACASSGVQLNGIQAGSYVSNIVDGGQRGLVKIGDLYAEEERDFLVHFKLPPFTRPADSIYSNEMKVLKVSCSYKDPVSQETIQTPMKELSIERPEYVTGEQQVVALEVDRQRNRLCTAESIAEARALADRNDLQGAQLVLGNMRAALQASSSAQAGDQLCVSLEAELKEIQDRMANRQLYESSGRAYVLSGLSSHSWQRATTRGDSTDSISLVYGYQTPTMVDMLMRSQTLCPMPQDIPSRSLLPSRSFPIPEARSSFPASNPDSSGVRPLPPAAWREPSEGS